MSGFPWMPFTGKGVCESDPGRKQGWRRASPRKHRFPEALRFHGKKRAPRNEIGVPGRLHPPAAAALTYSMCREVGLVPGLLRLCRGSKASTSHARSFIMHVRHSSGSALQSRAAALVKPRCRLGACCRAEGQRNHRCSHTLPCLQGCPSARGRREPLTSRAPKGMAACSSLGPLPIPVPC